MADLSALQEKWNTLYKQTLPSLARQKDPAQSKWPVTLDHCFGRIILDNAIGRDRPWAEVLKSPAYKHMSVSQLSDAIALGEKIQRGEVNLVELDETSLHLRGKASKADRKTKGGKADAKSHENESKDETPSKAEKHGVKRKSDQNATSETRQPKKPRSKGTVSSYFLPSPSSEVESHPKSEHDDDDDDKSAPDPCTNQRLNPLTNEPYPADLSPLDLISRSKITPFRKQVLTLLTQVPRGRYTTYQAMSDHISSTSHKTCARAIGNAMRNNPFAPVVPCHRVVASGGGIGGFGGSWGDEGEHAGKKKGMLREEGIRFDGKGRVVGEPFRGF